MHSSSSFESFGDEDFGGGDGDVIGQSAIALHTEGLVRFAGVEAARADKRRRRRNWCMGESVTVIPARKGLAMSLTSSTVAAISWPGMRGIRHHRILSAKGIEVRPAEAEHADAQQDFACLGSGLGSRADSNFPGFLDN